MDNQSGPLQKEEGTESRVQCDKCGHATVHRVIRSAEYSGETSGRGFSVDWWDDYQIIECLGCQTRSFLRRLRNSEDVDNDPETGELYFLDDVRLYPERSTARREVDGTELLPENAQLIYRETLAALRHSLPVLAGIGLRALVETVCKDRNAAGENLEQRIDNLVTQGVLTAAGADILHSLRIMGNRAAHEVVPHLPQDLNVAVDVMEHLLTGVYVLPSRAARLPRRPTKNAAS